MKKCSSLIMTPFGGCWRLAASRTVCEGAPGRAPARIAMHVADLRKREFEEVMRSERPHAVVHLGVKRELRGDERARHDLNVRGRSGCSTTAARSAWHSSW
jgi:hypothetical protein